MVKKRSNKRRLTWDEIQSNLESRLIHKFDRESGKELWRCMNCGRWITEGQCRKPWKSVCPTGLSAPNRFFCPDCTDEYNDKMRGFNGRKQQEAEKNHQIVIKKKKV